MNATNITLSIDWEKYAKKIEIDTTAKGLAIMKALPSIWCWSDVNSWNVILWPENPLKEVTRLITHGVLYAPGTSLIYSGTAIRHPYDHDNYWLGQKLAFSRALRSFENDMLAKLTKDEDTYSGIYVIWRYFELRRVFWEQFIAGTKELGNIVTVDKVKTQSGC